MVGRGNRKDEGSFTVSNSNVFAALESLRKKKKSDKEKGASKGIKTSLKGDGTGKYKEIAQEKQVYWAPAPLTVKSWADVDDEDDDDYYATTAPPQAIWGGSASDKAQELHKTDITEESESDDELLDEGDEDEHEHEHEDETDVHQQAENVVIEHVELPPEPKETEKQLSKKEKKKKELEELEAILADFGVSSKEKAQEIHTEGSKEIQVNGEEDNKNGAVTESKTSKKKKKKEKASKEEKEPDEEDEEKTESSSIDVKERLKKVAPGKKKKSNKEMDAAARAASLEAAARSAKLAAAKKKEKNHYNQQPTR